MSETKSILPPELRHFFFSALETQMMGAKESKPEMKDSGSPLSVTFNMSDEVNQQSYVFENYQGKPTPFSVVERDKLLQMVNYDWAKEKKEIRSISAKMDFVSRKIFIQKVKHDGTKLPLLVI